MKRLIECEAIENLKNLFSNYELTLPNTDSLETLQFTIKALEEVREYRRLEEQGLLIRLPVAEGSTVYVIDYILECKYDYDCKEIERCKCENDIQCEHEYKKYRVAKAKFVYGMMAILGKTVFLTREEAEAALERMDEDGKS